MKKTESAGCACLLHKCDLIRAGHTSSTRSRSLCVLLDIKWPVPMERKDEQLALMATRPPHSSSRIDASANTLIEMSLSGPLRVDTWFLGMCCYCCCCCCCKSPVSQVNLEFAL